MNSYVFMTDSDSDLPLALQQEWGIPVAHMPFIMDGQEYYDDLGETLDHKQFYDKMRAGAKVSTAALNQANYEELLIPIFEAGQDLLFICFSTAMSSTVKALEAAVEELLPRYPGRRFRVVDTLTISAPMTILLCKAHDLYLAGASMDEVADWVEKNRMRAQAFFTVDDLEYLKRGGRITGAAATMGKLLDLKPILVVNRDGLIVSHSKVRGRKKSLNTLADLAAQNIEDETEAPAFLIDADDPEDAEYLLGLLKERFPKMDIRRSSIGPVIGAHTGPGSVAFAFLGKERPI